MNCSALFLATLSGHRHQELPRRSPRSPARRRGQRTKTNARTRRGKKTTVSGTAKKVASKDIMATTTTTTVKKRRTSGKLAPVRCTCRLRLTTPSSPLPIPAGGALAACSAGACGFRGSKPGTAYARSPQKSRSDRLSSSTVLAKADVFC